MIDTLSSAVLAWLLTYLIHSTALLVLAWGITRVRLWSPGATDLFWKAALVGGLVSALRPLVSCETLCWNSFFRYAFACAAVFPVRSCAP